MCHAVARLHQYTSYIHIWQLQSALYMTGSWPGNLTPWLGRCCLLSRLIGAGGLCIEEKCASTCSCMLAAIFWPPKACLWLPVQSLSAFFGWPKQVSWQPCNCFSSTPGEH